jgi:hypothetical protein
LWWSKTKSNLGSQPVYAGGRSTGYKLFKAVQEKNSDFINVYNNANSSLIEL